MMPDSKPKWTPGPWKRSWASRAMGDYDPGEPCWDVIAGKKNAAELIVDACNVDRFVAWNHKTGDEDQEKRDAEITANMTLIAAAPDLYAALEALLSSLIQTAGLMVGTVEFAVGHSGNRELILQCQAALLKANPQRTQEVKDAR